MNSFFAELFASYGIYIYILLFLLTIVFMIQDHIITKRRCMNCNNKAIYFERESITGKVVAYCSKDCTEIIKKNNNKWKGSKEV